MTLPLRRRTIPAQEVERIKADIYAEIRDSFYRADAPDVVLDQLDELAGDADAPQNLRDVKNFSVEDHLRFKSQVDAIMAASREAPAPPVEPETPVDEPKRTGQNISAEQRQPEVLSMELLRQKSPEWHIEHRAEVAAYMSRRSA